MSSTDPVCTNPQSENTPDPAGAASAVEAIARIAGASDPPRVLDLLVKATTALGASASIYAAGIPEGGDETSCFALFACHPRLAQVHGNRQMLSDHPWARFSRTHTMPATDHVIEARGPADITALELARQYGFRSCLVIPVATGVRSARTDMLCIGSDRVDAFEGPDARSTRTLGRALAAELHDWLTHYLRERLRQTAQLEAEDLGLLAMEWQGLGSKEIGTRMGLSITCVDSRFRRLNARLNCLNRHRAAARAAAYGLLESTSHN